MRSTTELETSTLGFFAFGAATGFAAFDFRISVVGAKGGVVNTILGNGVKIGVVMGSEADWEAWNYSKVGNLGDSLAIFLTVN